MFVRKSPVPVCFNSTWIVYFHTVHRLAFLGEVKANFVLSPFDKVGPSDLVVLARFHQIDEARHVATNDFNIDFDFFGRQSLNGIGQNFDNACIETIACRVLGCGD